MSTLLYTSSVYDTIKGWSDTQDYQDGLNAIRREYELIGESEDYILDMVSDWVQIEMDYLLEQFEHIEDVVITGGLGRWDGTHTIVPTRADNLEDAFYRCGQNMDEVEIYDDNGVIEIVAYHHDGYNSFKIYQLNSKGINAGDNADLEKKTYHKKIRLSQLDNGWAGFLFED